MANALYQPKQNGNAIAQMMPSGKNSNTIKRRDGIGQCQSEDGSVDYGCYAGLINSGENINAVVLPPGSGVIDGWSMEVPGNGQTPSAASPIPKGEGSIPSVQSYEVPLINAPAEQVDPGAATPFMGGGGSFGGGGADASY